MSQILFFDTETNGMVDWKRPSGGKDQPHIVQLAAILCDEETMQAVDTMNVIVSPDGWDIPEEISDIHGITTEQALKVGITEKEALQMFLKLWYQCDLRVAHNTTFDNRIIRIALKRYLPNLIPDDDWKDKDRYFCTLQRARKVMGGKKGHTLAEAYKHFMGKELENAHDAMADTEACMHIYFAMKFEDTIPF